MFLVMAYILLYYTIGYESAVSPHVPGPDLYITLLHDLI